MRFWSKLISDSRNLITDSGMVIGDSGADAEVISFGPESVITFDQNG